VNFRDKPAVFSGESADSASQLCRQGQR
jgi:hypothetical protein